MTAADIWHLWCAFAGGFLLPYWGFHAVAFVARHILDCGWDFR
jgi:hypothetical protein